MFTDLINEQLLMFTYLIMSNLLTRTMASHRNLKGGKELKRLGQRLVLVISVDMPTKPCRFNRCLIGNDWPTQGYVNSEKIKYIYGSVTLDMIYYFREKYPSPVVHQRKDEARGIWVGGEAEVRRGRDEERERW